MSQTPPRNLNRRDFLKIGAAAGVGAALASLEAPPPASASAAASMIEFKAAPINPVRVAFVGVGGQGTSHVQNFLKLEGVQIKAVCDIVEEKVSAVQQMVVEAGHPKPAGYSRGPYDFKRLCETEDVDLVMDATPWEWHVPVSVAAMTNGKHSALEVPAAVTLDECWQLVETSERTRRHCCMLENCCYDRPEMLCLNLAKKGLLGEIIHVEAGYLHDLRGVKFSVPPEAEALWRPQHSVRRDGNLYPTHGLGPVSQCLDINRGDRYTHLVSMSTKSRGLNLYCAKVFGADSPQARQKYALGDVNVSLIHTANGATITLYHDTSSPRPYSRKHVVQGTQGIFERWPERVYIEGRSPKPHAWEDLDPYKDFGHPLWKTVGDQAEGAGHGGMDFLEDYRLVEALKNGRPLDMDVYDAAAWSVVGPLSEMSVAKKGKPVDVPDFTRGRWQEPRVLHVQEIE